MMEDRVLAEDYALAIDYALVNGLDWMKLQRDMLKFIAEDCEALDGKTVGDVINIVFERALLDKRFKAVPAKTLRYTVQAICGQHSLLMECTTLVEMDALMQRLQKEVDDVFHQIRDQRLGIRR